MYENIVLREITLIKSTLVQGGIGLIVCSLLRKKLKTPSVQLKIGSRVWCFLSYFDFSSLSCSLSILTYTM